MDYLGLIHWPASSHQFDNWEELSLEIWRVITDLYKSGKIRAIGVSNFKPHHLKALMETETIPMVNQIEYHPGVTQKATVDFCNDNGILVEAWSPLGESRILNEPVLAKIGEKYNKTPAQAALRWEIQNGILLLPKSVTPERIAENLEVFDFELSKEDMNRINDLDGLGYSGKDPDTINF